MRERERERNKKIEKGLMRKRGERWEEIDKNL